MTARVTFLLALWTIACPFTLYAIWKTFSIDGPGFRNGDALAALLAFVVFLAFVRAVEGTVFFAKDAASSPPEGSDRG